VNRDSLVELRDARRGVPFSKFSHGGVDNASR